MARLTVLQLAGALATLAQAGLLAEILSRIVIGGRPVSGLERPLVLLAGIAVVRGGVAAGQEWLVARASGRIRRELRLAVLTSVSRLGPAWADRQPSGRLATASGPGIESLDGYLTRAAPAMVAAAIVPPLVLARIGLADWRSAAILVASLPLVPLFMVLVGVTTRRRMEARYAALAGLAGHFLDLVEGLTTLKIYGQARRQVETVRRATDAYRRQTLQTLRVVFLSGLVLDLIATLSVAVVAVSIGLRLDASHVGLQSALVVLLLAPELFAPLRAVGAQHHAAEEGRVAVAAALDIVAEAAALPAGPIAASVVSDGSIAVLNLTVSYPGRLDEALRGISLRVGPGELVAVQGVSGGGKSTLLSTLLRFVEPTSGEVVVADRAAIAWVPQLPRPTQYDVGAEVLLGNASASDSEVLAAIEACQAPHPRTRLGEDGGMVSAGQRRRVAMARALLRARSVRAAGGVPIVLLDEPSEDLDEATEAVVAAVISGMAGWATVLMVTHSDRLAGIADRRLELADGRLVADRPQPRAVMALPVPRPATTLPAGLHIRLAPTVSWRPLFAGLALVRRRLIGAALLAGAAGLAGLALTATSVWLICRAAQHPNLQALAVAVVGVRTFALARAGLRYAERLVSHDAALRLLAEVRARVFAALEPLAPGGLAEFRRGDLLRRFVSDVDGAQEGLVRAVIPFSGAAITAAGAIVVAWFLVPAAGLVLAAGLAVGLVVAPLTARRLAGDAFRLSHASGVRDERATAFLDGLAELMAYGHDATAIAEVAEADEAVLLAGRRPAIAGAVGTGLTGLGAGLTMVFVLAIGAAAVTSGGPSPVAVGVLLAAALAGFDGLGAIPVAFAAWSRFRTGIDRVALLLATAPPVPEPSSPAVGPGRSLSLLAEGLAVAPAADVPAVVADASFVVAQGERVALMGPSGCGKSTLLSAVLRLLPVQGALELTGSDATVAIADLAAADAPPLVAGSLQGDHVFNTSLRDNLLVVRPEAGLAELDAVAASAGLLDFVRGLPDGWSTPAGRDGTALSGGQRQRLLLARALLADPAVLVLDEPTAHLDEATERAVLADLLAGTRGRTVLMSTHRRLPAGELDLLVHLADGGCQVTRPAPAVSR
jgi:ATP-binding cassette, subfamily C, bacterial CydCD